MDERTIRLGLRGLAIVGMAGLLAACGGGGGDSSAPSAGLEGDMVTPPGSNSAPTLSGNASGIAEVGKAYSFTPTAQDADSDKLTFSVTSLPSWASFSTTTGRLSGTPAAKDVGSHEEIVIAATDGKATTKLPGFTINVENAGAGGSGNVTVSWQPPQENTDGSALVNLSGYRIHYGTVSKQYTQTVAVNTAGVTRYVVEDLQAGTYYFSITAVAASGAESEHSAEVSASIS